MQRRPVPGAEPKPFQKPLPAPRGAPAQLQAARVARRLSAGAARRIRQYAGSCAGGPRDAPLMLEPLELLGLVLFVILSAAALAFAIVGCPHRERTAVDVIQVVGA